MLLCFYTIHFPMFLYKCTPWLRRSCYLPAEFIIWPSKDNVSGSTQIHPQWMLCSLLLQAHLCQTLEVFARPCCVCLGTEAALTDVFSWYSTSARSQGLQGVFLDRLHPFHFVSYYQRRWQLKEHHWTSNRGHVGRMKGAGCLSGCPRGSTSCL